MARTVKFSTRNVTKIFRMATPAQVQAGRDWYAEAYAVACDLDELNPARAAGILAALSPRNKWGPNVKMARGTYANGYASGTLSDACGKADKIFEGADPLDVLRGDKVRAFYGAIMGDESSVCIDRHAFDVAAGRVTDDKTRGIIGNVGVYDEIADCYRKAARALRRDGYDVTPAAVQAVTWVVWRQHKGIIDA